MSTRTIVLIVLGACALGSFGLVEVLQEVIESNNRESPRRPAATTAAPAAPARSLVLPSSAAGYTRQTGSAAQAVVDDMLEGMGPLAQAATPKAGLYAKGGEEFIFLGFTGTDLAKTGVPASANATTTLVEGMFAGMGLTGQTTHPPGPLGGQVRCGKASSDGAAVQVCAWTDPSTAGLLMSPQIAVEELAAATVGLRAEAER
ncbi:hypothetical protein [Spirillospora sp. NPDC047279]|uniref:hypothetical protein n=1 Tax=Spirillospora sp. NPDC047279 TaxID=3155478 RepID=UPI0033F8EEDE